VVAGQPQKSFAENFDRAAQQGQLLVHCRAVIAEKEPQIKAWAHIDDSESGMAGSPGALEGVPFGVKDVINVQAMPTRCGSVAEDGQIRQFDAASVGILRAAGAIPIGKTTTCEYAFRTPGPTKNPRNILHTPGGSSSGSAAAVAAGMVPFALSTQTGGSIIRPAAYCGVVGFKPTYGLVPRDGLKITCESLDVIGWHAVDLQWAKKVADVMLPKRRDESDVRPRKKVAIAIYDADTQIDNTTSDIIAAVRDRLDSHSIENTIIKNQDVMDRLAAAHKTIMQYEFARSLAPVVSVNPNGLSAALLKNVEEGLRVTGEQYLEMKALQLALRFSWKQLYGEADYIITPSAAGLPTTDLSNVGAPSYNKIWSVLGWPCCHLPLAAAPNNLSAGVQLVASFGGDHRLIQHAMTLDRLFRKEGG